MSVYIYRIQYENFLNGRDEADFVEENFPMNENGKINISAERIKELKFIFKNYYEKLAILLEIEEAVKEHGDFDVEISY